MTSKVLLDLSSACNSSFVCSDHTSYLWISWTVSSSFLPQGLCTWTFLCLECSSNSLIIWLIPTCPSDLNLEYHLFREYSEYWLELVPHYVKPTIFFARTHRSLETKVPFVIICLIFVAISRLQVFMPSSTYHCVSSSYHRAWHIGHGQ